MKPPRTFKITLLMWLALPMDRKQIDPVRVKWRDKWYPACIVPDRNAR